MSKNQRKQRTIPELVKVLYPPSKKNIVASSSSGSLLSATATGGGGSYSVRNNSSSLSGNKGIRFSQLLLDPGEKPVQDWAVVAFSAPTTLLSKNIRARSEMSRHLHHNTTSVNDPQSRNKVGNESDRGQQQPRHHHSTRSKKEITWFQSPDHKNKQRNEIGGSSSTGRSDPTSKLYHHNSTSSNGSGEGIDNQYHSSTTNLKNIQGRLYSCTGSLVFEPNDWSRGIIRFPFTKMDGPPVSTASTMAPGTVPENSARRSNSNNSNTSTIVGNTTGSYETLLNIQFQCRRHIVMKEDNRIGPYRQVSVPTEFRFVFLHSSPTNFLEMTSELFNSSPSRFGNFSQYQNTSSPSRSKKSIPTAVAPSSTSLFRQKNNGVSTFDVSSLVDVREQIQTTTPIICSIVSPLQNQYGILLITNERIYFQKRQWSYYAPVLKWSRSSITATARRYNGLRDSALEIYFEETTGKSVGSYSSVFFGFDRRHDREFVIRCLHQQQSTKTNEYNNMMLYETSSRNTGTVTVPCFTDREFVVQVANEWRNGTISNYEYLLALNCAAGRTFHDLSRYPVFPWIIQDYTSSKLDLMKESTFRDLSKPIGALTPERLEYFRTRFQSMAQDGSDELFLFGTHYSAPGYVLYFLVRNMPEHMLCLQNGKFDSPDRMFHSIASCWSCVLTNHADVKELIPEFYNPALDYDFLMNVRGLQLGATQNGDRVNDVKLPPWAKDSPREYLKQNIAALESEICSQNLPKWIDLIFGSKSRGQDALDANNLFHQYSYLGPNDLASMQSDDDRATAELQATEFGIVPDQLFVMDHPSKFKYIQGSIDSHADNLNVRDAFISFDIGRSSPVSNKDDPMREAWELLETPNTAHGVKQNEYEEMNSYNNQSSSNSNRIGTSSAQYTNSGPVLSNDGTTLNKSTPAAFNDNDVKEVESGIVTGFNNDASTGFEVERFDQQQSVSAAGTSKFNWDMKIIEKKHIHNDAVSGCVLSFDEEYSEMASPMWTLVTTSLDGGLKVHTISVQNASQFTNEDDTSLISSTLNRFSTSYNTILNRGNGNNLQSKILELRSHTSRDPLACLVVAGTIAFTGGHDDVILAYGIRSGCAVASVYSHRDAVTGLDLIVRTPFDAESSIWLEKSTHIMISGSWDATVKIWSASVTAGEAVAINRDPLAELFDADSSVVCVSSIRSSIYRENEHDIGLVVAAGCVDGSFCVWMVHSDGVQVLVHKEATKKGSGPCSVLKLVSEFGNIHLFAAFSTGKVASYRLNNTSAKRESAVSIGTGVLSMAFVKRKLLVGCADGSLRLLSMNDIGMSFDPKSRPILWPSLHNPATSPGISSVYVAHVPSTSKNNSESSSSENEISRMICCSGAEDGSIVLFELKEET